MSATITATKSGTRYTVTVDGEQITDRTSKAKDFTHAVVRRNDDGWTASLAASEEKAAKTAATTPDRYTEIHTVAFEEVATARSLAEDISATIDAVAAEHDARLDHEVEHITADGDGYTYTDDATDLADGEGPQVAPDEEEGYYRIIDTNAPHGPAEIMQFRHIDLTGEEENPDEQDDTEHDDDFAATGWVSSDPSFVDADDEEGPAALAEEAPAAPETAPEEEKAPEPAPAPAKPEKAPETPEEAEAKRTARAARRRERLATTDEATLAERKAKINDARKAKRAAETPEERQARLDKRAAYRARRKAAKEAAKETVNA